MELIIFWAIINALVGAALGSRKNAVGQCIAISILLGPIGWLMAAFCEGDVRKCPFDIGAISPQKGDGRFLLIYRELGATTPTQRPYKQLSKAKRVARETAVRLANGQVVSTPARLEQIGHIEKTAERFGVSPISAIEEWARW